MKRRYNYQYTFQSWVRNFKAICRQFVIPFCIFQGIRALIFPTFLDILLLIIFISIAVGFHYEWI